MAEAPPVLTIPTTTRIGLLDRLRVLVHGEVRNVARVHGVSMTGTYHVDVAAYVPRLFERPAPALPDGGQ